MLAAMHRRLIATVSATATASSSSSSPASSVLGGGLRGIARAEFDSAGGSDAVAFSLSSNTGAHPLLVARLRPTSRFVAAPGAVVAVSDSVENRLTSHTSIRETVSRVITSPLSPHVFFNEFWTSKSAGSVFLGTPRGVDGEICILRVGEPDGRELVVKRKSFLAATGGNVVIKTELNADGLSTYRLFNTGSVAFAAPSGSIHCVNLSVNEEIYVDPELLVAWDAGILVQATNENAGSKVAEGAPKFVGGNAGDLVAAQWDERFRKIGSAVADGVRYLAKLVLWQGKRAITQNKGMYRLKGPGELYMSSRRQPSLSWIKAVPPAILYTFKK